METYQHSIPAMEEEAASTIASLRAILRPPTKEARHRASGGCRPLQE